MENHHTQDMRNRMSKRFRSVRGSALTEFALISTLLVPLVMYGIYFFDLASINLKTQEISRYALWEMTSFPLSDYQESKHESWFHDAMIAVVKDVKERYGDDLDASTVGQHQDGSVIKLFSGTARLTGIQVSNESVNLGKGELPFVPSGNSWIDSLLEQFGKGLNTVLEKWGFNTRGRAQVEVKIKFSNALIPSEYAQEFNQEKLFSNKISTLEFSDQLTMIVDSWTLFDGEDVYPPGGYEKGGDDALLYAQVSRIVWMGLIDNLPFLGDLGEFLSDMKSVVDVLQIDWPFQTRVASIGSRGDDVNQANRIEVDTDVGQRNFHTTPIRDDWETNSSEYAKTYNARGNFYMGNQEPQKDCGQ